jgi:hypothetical protein
MAKSKRAVALFEVIQSSRSSKRSLSDVLSTPKWWFKRRPASMPPVPGPQAATSPAPQITTTALSTDVVETAPAPATPRVDLKMDPTRQRITFHISYTSAIVTAFAVLVVVGLAYVIGSRMRSGPARASAETSTDQLRAGAPRTGVLNVRPNPTPTRHTPSPEPDDGKTAAPAPPPRPPEPASQPTQRIIGLNYVVMQGYPPEEKAMAVEACTLLNNQGIPCTIEKDLPGLNRNWYIVVGQQGFERLGYNPAYEQYEQKIRDVNAKFPKNSKFKRLEPMPYKWRG